MSRPDPDRPEVDSTCVHDTPAEWHDVFFQMAKTIARRSKDPSTKVGAVLVGYDKKILSTGFNGPPKELDDDVIPWQLRPQKYAYLIHAEENALWQAMSLGAAKNIIGSTLYCTHYPCTECVLRCIRAGIAKVFIPHNHTPYPMSKYQVDSDDLIRRQTYPKLIVELMYTGD